ncbi:hypothetical protein [Rickettsia sp. TH2014]|uniref:hypothetical protein n=1 Tax=Rickettsia sp. TH2014 TaxID=1967503 RepID=UPI0021142BC7|nr:hypothetical protein [Rickettsia sp. TH2014]
MNNDLSARHLGITLLNKNPADLIFQGNFTIKEALSDTQAIIMSTISGNDINDYILTKYEKFSFLFDNSTIEACKEDFYRVYSNLTMVKIPHPTTEYILDIARNNTIEDYLTLNYNRCEIFEVFKGNTLQNLYDTIHDILTSPNNTESWKEIANNTINSTIASATDKISELTFSDDIKNLTETAISSLSATTQASDINTTEGWTESVTEYLSEMATNAVNNTITNSTAEISESIFSDNTESWTEKRINLINNTVANLTNTAFNSTYNPQENMFDESGNDNSLATYIGIGTAVAASIVVAISAGVTWYCVRSKNAKKAKLKQYIDEIEAERAAENKLAANDTEEHSAPLLNNSTEHNDHTTVDITGVSYEDEGTPV